MNTTEYKEAWNLFDQRERKLAADLEKGDLSEATFPRTGNEARIEIEASRATLQWILEMLPNPNQPETKLS